MEGTRRASTFDRLLAAVLTVAMAGYWLPATAFASTGQPLPAEIQGTILAADGLTAVPGVSVKAAHMATKKVFASDVTTKDGSYALTGLPAGQYDLAVETKEGLYVADVFVNAQPGTRTVVSLALKIVADDEEGEEGGQGSGEGEAEGQGQGQGDEPPEPPAETTSRKKGGGFWYWLTTPTGAAVAIGVSAIFVGAAANAWADDDEGDDDQFMTTVTP